MPMPQKSPYKTGLEELKKKLQNDFLKVTIDFLVTFSAFGITNNPKILTQSP